VIFGEPQRIVFRLKSCQSAGGLVLGCKCRIGFIWGVFLVAIVSLVQEPPAPEPPQNAFYPGAGVPQLPQLEVVEGRIRRNTTLVATLVDLDVPVTLANDLAALIQPVFDLRTLRPGNFFRLEKDPGGAMHAFEYKIDDERILKVEREDDAYAAKVETLPLEAREAVIAGEITAEQNSLFAVLETHPRGADLAVSLSEIFAWDVDFNSDLQRNDRFRVIVEAYYHDGEFVKWGRIQAAELLNSGRTYRGFAFNNAYYDAKGNALKRSILASPLKFSRVSSGFTRRRMHPILGTNRPHLAVDYAAPTGTPVQAVANGTVTFAGWNDGYGNLVQIRHRNGLTTGYAHLSRFAAGIRAGKTVSQNDTIGYVGQTGLATGPHLHYMMTENGRVINPMSKRSEPPIPIDAKLKPEFLARIAPLEVQLDGRPPVQDAN
jgi:murein DD-endopeptidase MepM/ murein hydrolase activator NlpD